MFAYCNVDFEDIIYEVGPAPNYDKSCYYDHKPDMILPNLPYIIHRGIKLSESSCCLKYVARTF